MKLTHEYNEYVVGYVVTDTETGRTLNFQLERIISNHPDPDFELIHSCSGDDTHADFTEEELEEAQEYVESQKDIKKWLRDFNEER